MQLDGYIRVSRVGGRSGESFISPEVQREQIERFAALRGVQIGAWHEDLDQTGGKLTRPGLDAAMQRVRSGATGGIAVARLDRLSRAGVADALKLVEDLYDCGGKLAAVDLGIDPTTTFGEFALTIMLALARMERRRITESWDAAQRRAVERGVHISSKPPTGYRRDERGTLVPNEHAPAVAEAFRLRAAGKSWKAVCAYLNAHGVPTPYGSTNWHTGSVQHIIGNRAYLGEARSGRHTNPDAHPAIIDRATWEAAQLVRGPSIPRGDGALLAGLLRCASCRYTMKPDRMTLRSGERVRIYRCRGEHSAGRCRSRASVLGSVIEPYVECVFFEAVGQLEAQPTVSSAEVEHAMQDLAAAEAALVAYRDDTRVQTLLGQDAFVEGLEKRAAAVADARATLAEASAAVNSGALLDRATLDAMWPDLDVSERQHLLRSAIDAVFLRPGRGLAIDERTLVLLCGEAPDDLPRRGSRTDAIRPFPWPDDVPGDAGEAVA